MYSKRFCTAIWRILNPDLEIINRIVYQDSINESHRRLNREYRLICIDHYSNGTMRCECCGEDIYEFLNLDHVDNDGAEDSKRFKSSRSFYKYLIDTGFQKRLKVMCFNCNCARDKDPDKICPHKRRICQIMKW